MPRTPNVPRQHQTPLPDAPSDPLEVFWRDRELLRAEVTALNKQLAEAMGTINGLRAELDAKDRELGRMERALGDKEVTISRLRGYAIAVRTRLAGFAEQAAALHAEAMSESVASIMGEADGEAGKPAGEAGDEADDTDRAGPERDVEAAQARDIISRLPRDRGLPDNKFG